MTTEQTIIFHWRCRCSGDSSRVEKEEEEEEEEEEAAEEEEKLESTTN